MRVVAGRGPALEGRAGGGLSMKRDCGGTLLGPFPLISWEPSRENAHGSEHLERQTSDCEETNREPWLGGGPAGARWAGNAVFSLLVFYKNMSGGFCPLPLAPQSVCAFSGDSFSF